MIFVETYIKIDDIHYLLVDLNKSIYARTFGR